MIQEKIDRLIMESMKKGEKDALRTYRAVKASFIEFRTAENAKPLDDVAEFSIIKKMIAERKKAIEDYTAANRQDLIDIESIEISYLEPFLPKEPTEEEIENFAQDNITEKGMQNMGKYMKMMKDNFPTVDGKILSSIVKKHIS